MRAETPYNPLDKKNLGLSVADALLSRPVDLLPPGDSFLGAGVYAIYYFGDYPAYKPLAERNRNDRFEQPIYIGKAIPAGGRKGGFSQSSAGPVLYNRLSEHADSIRAARNLLLEDFGCRYLVVDDIWIPLGETMLVEQFGPLWNRVIDGYGNHDPGKGRYFQKRSPWDVLHPGRAWAMRCADSKKSEVDLLEQVARHFGTG
ncbi:MAG TPA: Eco29kI family restriction endonuclease [Dongiaceae bacterium]|nr:Eco29kI family restriction endonuclease [Dongiaceae bacterium]